MTQYQLTTLQKVPFIQHGINSDDNIKHNRLKLQEYNANKYLINWYFVVADAQGRNMVFIHSHSNSILSRSEDVLHYWDLFKA